MTVNISTFIASLMPIDCYRFSGCPPFATSVHLSARSHQGGILTLQGQRSGLLSHKSEGNLTTPFGDVVFHGVRSIISGEEHVSLNKVPGCVTGQLVLPKCFGMASCSNRATLLISGDASLSFTVWRPSVGFQETVGHFRPHKGTIHRYKIFSRNDGDAMFQDEATFAQMGGDYSLVLLTSLLYFCIYPGYVADRE